MTHKLVNLFRSAVFVAAAAVLASPPMLGHAQSLRVQTVAQGLDRPWSVAFLPQGRFLVSERPGRLRVVEADGKLGAPLSGVPAVATGGQAGLFDVVPDSGFASNRQIYFCYAE